LAVDWNGNPAFIDENNRIVWKRNGLWTTLDTCAKQIAFGGRSTLIKISCIDDLVHEYHDDTEDWQSLSEQADTIMVDKIGNPWIVNSRVKKWDKLKTQWYDMGLTHIQDLTAGPKDTVYAVSALK